MEAPKPPENSPSSPDPTDESKHATIDSVLWSALSNEPGTSLGIYGINGEIVWINKQSAREFFGGKTAVPADVIGKTLTDTHGPQVAKEWAGFYKAVIERAKPVLVRSILNGNQYLTWLHPISHDLVPDGETEAATNVPLPDRVLSVTRAVGGEPDLTDWTTRSFDFFESKTVDLGPLDVLTPRELEVLALLGQGLSAKEAARVLHRSVKTIVNHRTAIGQKLKVNDRLKLADIAHRAGLQLADAERTRTGS